MTTRRTVLAAMASAMMLSGAAYAQSATGDNANAPQMGHWQPPSPETMQHMLDGRIAMIKTALQLNPDQDKLWAPVEQVMRDQAAARSKRMADMQGKHDDMAKMDPVARLEMTSQRATERAASAQKLADALKPLYATLSDEQKAVAMLILEPHGGPGRGRGHMMRG